MGAVAPVVTAKDVVLPAGVVGVTVTACTSVPGGAAIPAIAATTSETIHCCSVGRELRDAAAIAPSDCVCAACSRARVFVSVRLAINSVKTSALVRIELCRIPYEVEEGTA